MAPVKNGRVLFNEVPEGLPIPGKTTVYDESQTIDLENVALNGGILVKLIVLSIDPYLRLVMVAPTPPGAPSPLGKPLSSFGVGKVLRSESSDVNVGDHIYGVFNQEQYPIIPSMSGFKILKNEENLPWSNYTGVAGMPGLTAYAAWKEYSKAKKGETVFVTTGAGPVGATVVQFAKRDGLKVIASAGSDEKVQFMKEIGVDVPFNYKTTDTKQVLAREGGIDIYWDHVGGEVLDIALDAAHPYARFIECGMIASYNTTEKYPIKNIFNVLSRYITMTGFGVFGLVPKYASEFDKVIPGMIKRGEIKVLEDKKTGLDKVGEALLDVLTGKNYGKSVVVVADS